MDSKIEIEVLLTGRRRRIENSINVGRRRERRQTEYSVEVPTMGDKELEMVGRGNSERWKR
ncbi:MAG: hypothetical protein II951_02105 [Bacteroidales bacterium]|nr:hypothetical protein [Bacteroidales bacterium]